MLNGIWNANVYETSAIKASEDRLSESDDQPLRAALSAVTNCTFSCRIHPDSRKEPSLTSSAETLAANYALFARIAKLLINFNFSPTR